MSAFRIWLGKVFMKLWELTDKLSMLVGGLATIGFAITGVAALVGLVGGPETHSWWAPFSGQHQAPFTATWQYAVVVFGAWLVLHLLVRVLIGAIGMALFPRWYRDAVNEFGQMAEMVGVETDAGLTQDAPDGTTGAVPVGDPHSFAEAIRAARKEDAR